MSHKQRWTKQKAGTQSSKARKLKPAGPTSAESSGAGSGTLSVFRGGFKNLFGSKKPTTPTGKFLDALLWVAIGIAALVFIGRRCASP